MSANCKTKIGVDMGIVIEQRPFNFSGGTLQSLGKIGTSAVDAAVAAIAASTKAIIDDGDKGIIDDGLKFFGGFDQNSFELAKTDGNSLAGQFQNVAEYGKPSQILSNDARYQDALSKMQDPQFKVSDGLASFARKQITKIILGQIQNNIPISQDSLIKLQKLDVTVKHQLDLYQAMSKSNYRTF
jgi:hypothetical protein